MKNHPHSGKEQTDENERDKGFQKRGKHGGTEEDFNQLEKASH